MRNLKRFLAMALTVLMVVGSFSAMSVSAFEDVTDYQEAIDVMAALGILKGTDEEADLFSPEENIARWQMALIITKMMTGKVDAAYVEANFNTSINSTLYTDLNEGQYMGATAYAANNGIVVGTSATTYEPEAEIMIQDVFTMVVRMLGYGSTAMNANYPWSFIDKAISLGLDAGLPADYANEKAATRGETAQILYNALTAVKADGSTLGYDFFGLEKATVIITGTKAGNMFTKAAVVTKTVDGVDQVAFNVLNADGSIGATTYYAPKTAFGIEGNANAYVGYPFVVRTNDAFASFLTVEQIAPVALDQDDVVGAASNTAPANGIVTVDGTAYTLVDKYSDFIKDNSTEIILTTVGSYANVVDFGTYVMNEDLDILDKNGNVLLEWHEIGNVNGAAFQNGTYLYKVADGKYIVPNDAIWAMAATYTTGETVTGFKAIKNSNTEIEAKDAYSDTIVFDIDGDGDYDRGIYTQYSFAKMTKSGDFLAANGTKIDSANKLSAMTVVTAEGEAVDVVGKYVLYAYNPVYKTVIVKAIYDTTNVLVTGVDLAAAKITFNAFGVDFITGVVAGETYDIGKAKLAGVVTTAGVNSTYFTDAIGKNAVVVIDEDGDMLAIEKYADAANYMVVTNTDLGGYTTLGYKQIMGLTSTAAVKEIITVNAVNNYWYATPAFAEGELIELYKDALGYYDVKAAAYNYTAATNAKISVKNGIVSATGIASFPTFAATSDLVWIVNNGNGKYETYIGVPATGAYVDVDDNAKILYKGKFIYVNGGEFAGETAGNNAWGNAPVQSTIVYLDDAALATRVETNVLAGVNIFGTVTTYSKAIDMINGGYANVTYTDNNYSRLTKGFYKVEAGRIVGEATDEIGTALLAGADRLTKWNYTWIEDYVAGTTYYTDDLDTVDSVLPTLYLEGKGVTDQLVKTSAGAFTDAYKALNDDTTDGKDDALVVYYAKAMFADSKPIFLAKDITVDATLVKYVAPAAPVTPATYAVVFGGEATAIENGNGTFKFYFEAAENVEAWAVVDKNFEYVDFDEIGFNRYAVAVTADMFEANTNEAYDYDYVLYLNIDAIFAEEEAYTVNFYSIYDDAFTVDAAPVATGVDYEDGKFTVRLADGYELVDEEIIVLYHAPDYACALEEDCDHWLLIPEEDVTYFYDECVGIYLDTEVTADANNEINVLIIADVAIPASINLVNEDEVAVYDVNGAVTDATISVDGLSTFTDEVVYEIKVTNKKNVNVYINGSDVAADPARNADTVDIYEVVLTVDEPVAEVVVKEVVTATIEVSGSNYEVYEAFNKAPIAETSANTYEVAEVETDELADLVYYLKVTHVGTAAPTVKCNGTAITGELVEDYGSYSVYEITFNADGIAEVVIG